MTRGAAKRIVILGQSCEATWMTANFLSNEFEIAPIVIEQRVPRLDILRARARRIGWAKAIGQGLFVLWSVILKERSAHRIQEIKQEFGLVGDVPAALEVVQIDSVNSQRCIEIVRRSKPDAIVVSGTRIISASVLEAFDMPVINVHCGITPAYRGVHGGYWALAKGDAANAGVTVHLVDAGIDTGKVIAQATFIPRPDDNFSTYPYLQLGLGLPLLAQAIREPCDYSRNRISKGLPSELFYHPTLLEYACNRMLRGVR